MQLKYVEYKVITKVIDLLLDNIEMQPITRSLVCHLVCDLPCSEEAANAYGITSQDHYQALQSVIHTGILNGNLVEVIKQFDAAANEGEAIHALIAQYARQYSHLTFEPGDDFLNKEVEQEYSDDSLPF